MFMVLRDRILARLAEHLAEAPMTMSFDVRRGGER